MLSPSGRLSRVLYRRNHNTAANGTYIFVRAPLPNGLRVSMMKEQHE